MSPARAIATTLFAALAWGTGNVAQKTILAHLDGYSANGITALIGAAVLVPLALREGRAAAAPERGAAGVLIAVSLLFTLATTLLQFSYGMTSVANAGFLVNTAAVLTPALAWLCLRQRPTPALWPASLLALSGIYLMTGGGWTTPAPGDLLALASALAFAFWMLAVGIYVMRTRRPMLLTAVQLAVAGVICTGLGAANGLPAASALMQAMPEILYIGVISKGLAYGLTATAQQHLSATVVSVLVCAEAVFGALIAAVVLGERLGPGEAIGSACIILGVVIAARASAAPPAPVRAFMPS